MAVIRKIFGNGQVTLPKEWRDNFATSVVQMSIGPDGVVTIKPLEINSSDNKDWKTDNISLNDLDKEDQKLVKSGRKSYKEQRRDDFETIDDFFA